MLEFSTIEDALQAAQDGDVIQLLPGTHITSQVRTHLLERPLVYNTAAGVLAVICSSCAK
jgi:hypothetical protein